MGYQILVSLGKEKVVFISTIIGALFNIILNAFLVIPLGHVGASISSVIAEGAIALFQYYYVKKFVPIEFGKRNLINIIMLSSIMSMAMILPIYMICSPILEILIATILGVTVYIIVGFLIKNEFICMLKDYFVCFVNTKRWYIDIFNINKSWG